MPTDKITVHIDPEFAVDIDPEFASLIPPLTPEELAQLEQNILAEGCRDALVVWDRSARALFKQGMGTCKSDGCKYGELRKRVPLSKWAGGDGIWECPECGYGIAPIDNDILLDGHNRYKICREHKIKFSTRPLSLPDREAAADWIDANQLGRRNLTPEAASLLRGRRYNRTKRQDGGHGDQKSGGQNVPPKTAAATIATQHNVNEKTVKRDGQFASAVEKLKPTIPDIEKRVMTGNVPSKKAVMAAAKQPAKARSLLDTTAHVSHNTGESEWYTPLDIIADVRKVMGDIDVDPASCKKANETVKAKVYFDAASNGLVQKWKGRIFINPPYSQPLVTQFSEALVSRLKSKDVKQACVLVNNATETAWFQAMLAEADAVCFIKGRVKFIDQYGNPGAPLQGQAVLYMGPHVDRLNDAFKKRGIILFR